MRFGYSLLALTADRVNTAVFGWDSEQYEPGSCAIATAALEKAGLNQPKIIKADTRTLVTIGNDEFDIFHVDGDHSNAGCTRDMKLAWAALKSGGVMLVDDFEYEPAVRSAVRVFCVEKKLPYAVLPSFRGLAYIPKP